MIQLFMRNNKIIFNKSSKKALCLTDGSVDEPVQDNFITDHAFRLSDGYYSAASSTDFGYSWDLTPSDEFWDTFNVADQYYIRYELNGQTYTEAMELQEMSDSVSAASEQTNVAFSINRMWPVYDDETGDEMVSETFGAYAQFGSRFGLSNTPFDITIGHFE